MKKILIIFFALLFGVSAMAQNYFYDSTQKYGFWSNWSVGVHVSAADNIIVDNNDMIFNPGIGAGIDLTKQLSNHWYFRVIGDAPVIVRFGSSEYNRVAVAMVGTKYKPSIDCGLYTFIDAGIASRVTSDFHGYFTTDFGFGYQWDVCDHSIINVEALAMSVHPTASTNVELNGIVRLGWAYKFGLTKVDKEIADQRKLLLENSNMCANEYESLVARHRDTCEKLQALQVVFNQQDQTIRILRDSVTYLTNVIDSLWNSYDSLTNFISAPTVVFNVNSATISSDQNAYVDYIANLVKNCNDTVYVYGYADSQSGSDAYNQKLSEKRANALKDALIRKGCKREYIIAKGLGSNVFTGDSNSAATRKAIVIVPNNEDI